jgi:DNA-binding NarL/FixJ family response regulator
LIRARVIIAEDHETTQDAIWRLLSGEYDVIEVVSDGRAAIDAVVTNRPDIAILDISMPVMNGITAARALRARYPELKIVLLSAYADQAYIDEAFRIGVHGYVLKDAMSRDLPQALQTVLSGDTYRPLMHVRM